MILDLMINGVSLALMSLMKDLVSVFHHFTRSPEYYTQPMNHVGLENNAYIQSCQNA